MPAKKKKMVSRSKLGTTFVTHGWGHDECRKLVEAVMKLGGKVPGWYTILAEKQEFRHRSAHSINSQYNQLLRTHSPLVDPSILREEQLRRDTMRRNREMHPKAKILKTKGRVRKRRVSFDSMDTFFENANETEADAAMRSTSKEYKMLYRKVFWGKAGSDPFWPCLTVPPNVSLDKKELQEVAKKCIDSNEKEVFVYWFGHSSYSNVLKTNLKPWTNENRKRYLQSQPTKKRQFDVHKHVLAFREAELFVRGRPSSPETRNFLKLFSMKENQDRITTPISNEKILLIQEEKRLVSAYVQEINDYLEEKHDQASAQKQARMEHIVKIFSLIPFSKKELVVENICEVVAKLCLLKQDGVSDLAVSLLNLWNQQYHVVSI